MRCTYSDGKGVQCQEDSTMELEWSQTILPGWVIKTNRVYCKAHGDATLNRLEGSHQAVNVYEGKKVSAA